MTTIKDLLKEWKMTLLDGECVTDSSIASLEKRLLDRERERVDLRQTGLSGHNRTFMTDGHSEGIQATLEWNDG